MSLGTVLGACGVCAHDPVERAALVAMTVEATNEVPAVLVAEGNCNILGGHFKLVDHVPAREVPGSEVEASRPPCGGSDGLPVVGTRAWRPVLATQRDEAELALASQPRERVAGVRGQRRIRPQMVLGRANLRVAALNCSATTIRCRSKSIRSQRSASSSPGRRRRWRRTPAQVPTRARQARRLRTHRPRLRQVHPTTQDLRALPLPAARRCLSRRQTHHQKRALPSGRSTTHSVSASPPHKP
jgi:hypothetical protein